MENKKEKIAGVVVTYNRKELLKECLDALLSQTYPLDSIILIDNASTDGTPEFLKENGYLDNPKIDYVRLLENIGGAGGFYEGVKRGYEKGYDWLWLMDDDAIVQKNTLEELIKAYLTLKKNNEKIGMIGSVAIANNNNLSWVLYCKEKRRVYRNLQDFEEETVEVDFLPFLSVLIERDVIKKIGYPDKKFFIWGDDLEYCYRIIKNQMKIFVTKKGIVRHPLAIGIEISFLKKKVFVKSSSQPPWKDYYDARNYIFIIKKHKLGIGKYFRFGGLIILSLFKRDQKFKRARYYLKGIIDGFFK